MRYNTLAARAEAMKQRITIDSATLSYENTIKDEGVRRILWTKEQFHRAIGPMVYIVWELMDNGTHEAMYVGMTGDGLSRPCNARHHVMPKLWKRLDSVEFLCCESKADAAALEKRLIRMLCPKWNTTGLPAYTIRKRRAIRRK